MAANVGNPWAFSAGIAGNIISFMVFFAPAATFYKIHKKKSTESFDSLPYVVSLFSAMLWLYFGILTSDVLLITINVAGCVIEAFYVLIFLIYADRKPRVFTLKLLMFLNVGLFGCLLLLTLVFMEGKRRISILGWAGCTFSITVFLSPLSVIRLVIKTKSVEFMPFTLSFFLTLNAIAWFSYGILRSDYYVAMPNVIGFIFGVAQMIIYIIYKKEKKMLTSSDHQEKTSLPEVASAVMEMKTPVAISKIEEGDQEKNFCKDPVMVVVVVERKDHQPKEII